MEKAKKNQCPCCYHFTLDGDAGRFDICPVCYWEDDGLQRDNIDYSGGANQLSLREARKNYKKWGVSDVIYKDSVRLPKKSELCMKSTK